MYGSLYGSLWFCDNFSVGFSMYLFYVDLILCDIFVSSKHDYALIDYIACKVDCQN